MLLEEAKSQEDVVAALAAGDEELRDDIDMLLRDLARTWEANERGEEDELDDMLENLEHWDDFIEMVIRDSGHTEYPLTDDMVEGIKEELPGPFKVEWHSRFFSYPVKASVSYFWNTRNVPEYAEFIPSGEVDAFFADLGYGVEWDRQGPLLTDDVYGSGEGETHFVTTDAESFVEFCFDIVSRDIERKLSREPPEVLRRLFYERLSAAVDEEMSRRVRAANLPDEDVKNLLTDWFASGYGMSRGKDEVVEQLEEYLEAMSVAGVEREVVAEVTKEDLQRWGIVKGPLWEEAPWRLIKLLPADLRLEGTRMSHCVGKGDMGYIRSVKAGEIEIWSLRSRSDKPRFTLEVDSDFFERHPEEKADAILQLKGKANRTPGYADKAERVIFFPEEVVFWRELFEEKLGVVGVRAISDFAAIRTSSWYDMQQQVEARPNVLRRRSFDEPHRPMRRNIRRPW